jgi:hypothetical protein
MNDPEMDKMNKSEASDEMIGLAVRRAMLDVKPNMMLLWHSLQKTSDSRPSPFAPGVSDPVYVSPARPTKADSGKTLDQTFGQKISAWVSVWKISLPAAVVLIIIALGAWQDRASLLLLSQDLTGRPVTTEEANSGQNPAKPIAVQTVSPGDSNADLNQDLSLVNSKLDNINSDSSALDQSLGNKTSSQ